MSEAQPEASSLRLDLHQGDGQCEFYLRRVAAQVVSGIRSLGAGIIFREGLNVHGAAVVVAAVVPVSPNVEAYTAILSCAARSAALLRRAGECAYTGNARANGRFALGSRSTPVTWAHRHV